MQTGDVNSDGRTVSAPKRSINIQVRGWDPENRSAVEDFEKNIEVAASNDVNIRRVEVSPEEVSVDYARSAKLFGFLPITVNLHAVVDKDGNLKIRKPWYRFLTTSDIDEFSTALKAEFDANQEALLSLKIQDLLQKQSQYFQTLSALLKVRHEATTQ